jgi:ATP-dependent Clp protease ATP-binding subunit ClpA
MNERFSDRARHALALANLEAGRLNHRFLAPEHLLLGLIAEGECVATEALRVLAVDLEKVRQEIQRQMKAGDAGDAVGLRPQTKETRHVIELAIRQARGFGHRYVGTEHLVLALLEFSDGLPSRILKAQGISAEKLREKVLSMLSASVDPTHDLSHSRHGHFEWAHQQELAKAFRSQGFWRTMLLSVDAANRLGAGEIRAEHVLLGLLQDEHSTLPELLRQKGVTAEWLSGTTGGG